MEYLSFSRLSLLETCGLRFFYEYVEMRSPIDTVPTYHANFGRLLHQLYEDHANSKGHMVFTDLKGLFDQRFPDLVPEFPTREQAVVFYKNGIQAIARFSRYQVDHVIASEQTFLLELDPEVPPLKGFIDRVIYVPEHGYIVADLKTGKVFSASDVKKMRQLVLYSVACEHLFGQPAQSGYFDFVVHQGRQWIDISAEDRFAARAWVKQKWDQIQRGIFTPRYSHGFCSVYCPFRSCCPEYAKRETPVGAPI